jgi:pseudouridine kinase
MTNNEQKILELIRGNPFIAQDELSKKVGLSRSSIAGYISNLIKKGKIVGRAYVLPQEQHITCIGGANVDRKAQVFQPILYKTSNPATFTQSCGGVARNVAENLGRLGCSASLITCVGEDTEGTWLLEKTKQHHVDISQSVVIPMERTGTYTAIISPTGEMKLALADMEIYEKIELDMVEKRWSFISSSQMVFIDTNLPSNVLSYIIERCEKEDIPLCINPVSSPKAKKLPEKLHGVEVVFTNIDEAEVLSGMTIATKRDYMRASEEIMKKGVNKVIMTLGDKGIYVATQSGKTEHMISPKVTPVDVTGAGDSLIAGVLLGLSQGESLSTSCRLGMKAASLTLQTKDTVHPHLSRSKLYEQIELI